MNEISDDDIDFSHYLNLTDHDHKVKAAKEYAQDVIDYFHNPKEDKGACMPWGKTHENIRFRRGEVTVWGGYNGHGKSLVLGQIINGFIRSGEKTCIASLEMKPKITLARMCRQAAGRIPSKEYIESYHEATDEALWMYDQQGVVKGEKLIAVVRYAVDKFKIGHFVIDSLMKCGFAEDDYNGQKNFVDMLCSTARDLDIHIHLVHHSRKGKDELAPPGKHDMKGSGAIIDQVDNLIIVWRNKAKEEKRQSGEAVAASDPDALLIVEKQRNGEWEGKIALWFNPNGRGLSDQQ